MENPSVQQTTSTNNLALPVPAIICIAIGAYLVVIVIILVVRQVLLKRGMCAHGGCCGKEGEPCCECCIACSESVNCCRSPNIEACLDSICPARRKSCTGCTTCCHSCYERYFDRLKQFHCGCRQAQGGKTDCADIIMCQCCSDPNNQCCSCCGQQDPVCDCGNCDCQCNCQTPNCDNINCCCFQINSHNAGAGPEGGGWGQGGYNQGGYNQGYHQDRYNQSGTGGYPPGSGGWHQGGQGYPGGGNQNYPEVHHYRTGPRGGGGGGGTGGYSRQQDFADRGDRPSSTLPPQSARGGSTVPYERY